MIKAIKDINHKILTQGFIKTTSLTAFLTLIVSLGACGNDNTNNDKAKNLEANNTETTKSSVESSNQSFTNNMLSTDTTLSKLTLQSVLESVKTPLQADKTIDNSVLTCINNISDSFALEEVQNFFNTHFSDFELDNLNDFYKSDEAIAYTNYGRDQVLIASGISLKSPAKKPKKKDMEKVDAFSRSELGQKYISVTQSTGEGSLTSLVMPLLNEEIKKCGIPV